MTPLQRQLANEKAIARLGRVVARDVATAYRAGYSEIRSALAEIFEKYAVGGVVSPAELAKYNRLANLEKQVLTILGRSNQVARAKVEAGKRFVFQESLKLQAEALQEQAGRAINFGRIPEATVKAAIENPLEKIGFDRLRANGRNNIRSAIAQNLINGGDFTTTARSIRKSINGTAFDALRIARTETHRVQNQAHLIRTEQVQELGFEIRKVWVSVGDDRTRPDHVSMDGEYADKDGNFRVGGSVGPAPGSLQGSDSAEQNINCRCTYYEEIIDT